MTLLKSVEQLKQILGGIQKEMYWKTWQPAVEGAALMYLIPNVGDDLYDQLAGLQQPDTKQARLIKLLQYSEGFYALYDLYPQLVTSIGDLGVGVTTPDKTSAISKWLYQSNRADFMARGEEWLEKALEYLEKNASAFPIWTSSPFYTIQKELFLASIIEFRDAFPASKGSRRLWLLMRDYVRKSQQDYIRPLIGPELYKDWLAKLSNPGFAFTDHEKEALRLLRICLANHAVFKSIPYLNLNEEFRIIQEREGNVFNEVPDQNRIKTMWNECQSEYQTKAAELKKYLDTHASAEVFPAYFQSPIYTSSLPKAYKRIPNDPNKSHFVL